MRVRANDRNGLEADLSRSAENCHDGLKAVATTFLSHGPDYRRRNEALLPAPRSSVKRISRFSRTSTNWQL